MGQGSVAEGCPSEKHQPLSNLEVGERKSNHSLVPERDVSYVGMVYPDLDRLVQIITSEFSVSAIKKPGLLPDDSYDCLGA